MIRRDNCSGWILISQTDHSILSGEIMKYWGNRNFPVPLPEDEVLFAVKQHDNGWDNWEKSPKINHKNKYPKSFLEMDYKEQEEIWRRCFTRYRSEHPYASCLIALHFDKFNNNICRTNSKAEYLRNEIRNFLKHNLHMTIEEIEHSQDISKNLKYVQIGDIISLALCHGWKSVKLDDVPAGPGNERLFITIESEDAKEFFVDPFPFNTDIIELTVDARYLSKKTFSSNIELRENMIKSERTNLNFKIINPN